MPKYSLASDADYRRIALTMARLCGLAYRNDPTTADPDMRAEFPQAINLSHPTTEGFVCANDDHLVIVIRGTDEPDDWLANLDFTQMNHYGGAIHRGFWLALNQIWSEVVELIEQLDNGRQHIWVTGHSLGGALAVLVAKRLEEEYRRPQAVFTFGAPRVANPSAVAAFDAIPFFRFVNYDDLVPYLPFRFLGPKFVHLGDVYYFTRGGRLVDGARPWLALFCHAGRAIVLALAWYTVGREKAIYIASAGIREHAIGEYIAKLAAVVDEVEADSENVTTEQREPGNTEQREPGNTMQQDAQTEN